MLHITIHLPCNVIKFAPLFVVILLSTYYNVCLAVQCTKLQYLFQVHVAFKRALLTFHPDRASQSDIRKQVEAEEKFKLVTRMKEKYLSTLTCKPPA